MEEGYEETSLGLQLGSHNQVCSFLTYAECDVKQAHANIQAEEKNCIGHFTKHEDVAYMLLHGD